MAHRFRHRPHRKRNRQASGDQYTSMGLGSAPNHGNKTSYLRLWKALERRQLTRIVTLLTEYRVVLRRWLAECRQNLFGEKLQHLRMTSKRRVDELDFKVRDAGIGISANRAADFFRRSDETHFRKLIHCQQSFKRGASYGECAKAIFPCFSRILVYTSIDFNTEMDRIWVSAERRGHLLEFSESFRDISRQKPSRQPAVSKRRGSFHCGFGPPSDPEGWMWLLTRLRADLRIPKGDKVAFIAQGLTCPNHFHGPDLIIGDLAS